MIYTLNTRFEHRLLCPLLWSILNMYLHTSQKCWERQLDDLNNKQDVQEAIAIKWMNQSIWPPTYYSSHYCINAMKQYRCVAKIQVTLYCNMANWSSFARYCCWDHPIATLSTSVMYANTCSEWIKAMGIITDAQIMYSKCMPSVITAPQCMKFLIDLAAPCWVCPTLHSPILANMILLIIILWQSTTRAPFFKVMMICMTMMIVQLAMMLTMTAIVCVIPVTAMNYSPFSKIVVVPMEMQRSSSMGWTDISSTKSHHRTRLGSYLIIQMTSLSLLNSRYHHHANWTWVHMSLSSCCS